MFGATPELYQVESFAKSKIPPIMGSTLVQLAMKLFWYVIAIPFSCKITDTCGPSEYRGYIELQTKSLRHQVRDFAALDLDSTRGVDGNTQHERHSNLQIIIIMATLQRKTSPMQTKTAAIFFHIGYRIDIYKYY